MKITNKSPGALVLPLGEVVQAGETIDVDAKAWASHTSHPAVAGLLEAGSLVADGEAPAAPRAKKVTVKDAE